jgi:hypothetical protein
MPIKGHFANTRLGNYFIDTRSSDAIAIKQVMRSQQDSFFGGFISYIRV